MNLELFLGRIYPKEAQELMRNAILTNSIAHVVPINDLFSHIEVGTRCHCKPRVEKFNPGIVVVHNSYDFREFDEE